MKAGQVHRQACQIAEDAIQVGVHKSDVVNHVEGYIKEEAGLAFPVNICVNNEVAHKSPHGDDETVFTENDVVSVDIGVHSDGYVADGALSIDLSDEHEDLLEANKKAVNEALSIIRDGINVNTVGSVIEETLRDSGYSPIRNLFGHGVDRYEAHTEPKIPNSEGIYSQKLRTDDVIAIEPFATTDEDMVGKISDVSIFEFIESKSIRNTRARDMLTEIEREHSDFPFSRRQVTNYNKIGMKTLIREGVVKAHPLLSVENGIVSQFEHTVIVKDNGYESVTSHFD